MARRLTSLTLPPGVTPVTTNPVLAIVFVLYWVVDSLMVVVIFSELWRKSLSATARICKPQVLTRRRPPLMTCLQPRNGKLDNKLLSMPTTGSPISSRFFFFAPLFVLVDRAIPLLFPSIPSLVGYFDIDSRIGIGLSFGIRIVWRRICSIVSIL